MPYDFTQPPAGTDLETFLLEAGIILEGLQLSSLELAAAAALTTFQTRSGFTPFQAAAVASGRAFNAPGGRLPHSRSYVALLDRLGGFGGGDGSVVTGDTGGGKLLQLEAGIIAAPTAVTLEGNPLTLGSDYWCRPLNAPAEGRPYTRLKFAGAIFCAPEGIVVTARWGYGAVFPADAYFAILMSAAATATAGTPNKLILANQSEDDLTVEFLATSALVPAFRMEQWRSGYKSVLGLYRLVS